MKLKLQLFTNPLFVPTFAKLIDINSLDMSQAFALAQSIGIIQDKVKHYDTMRNILIKKYGAIVPKTETAEEQYSVFVEGNSEENMTAWTEKFTELCDIEFDIPLESQVVLPKTGYKITPAEIYSVLSLVKLAE